MHRVLAIGLTVLLSGCGFPSAVIRSEALDFGEVIARGTPEEVRTDPVVQRAYLGDAVQVDDAIDSGSGRHA